MKKIVIKIIVSFVAMIVGWLSGFLYYIVFSYLTYGYVTDVEAMLGWPGIFIFMWWLLFWLPLIILCNRKAKIFSLKLSPWFGGVYGLIGYFILCGWILEFHKYPQIYYVYAMITGAVTSLVYSIFLNSKFENNQGGLRQ